MQARFPLLLGLMLSVACDDPDPTRPDDVYTRPDDQDGDGVPEADDCDDRDASLGAIAEDADCDGVLTAADCDDTDASSTIRSEDADCDGVLTAADCDDSDPSSTSIAEDADCDGVLTAEDCDDTDASSTIRSEDADCDGLLTDADCDDSDPSSTGIAEDADCDGTVAAEDCDDTDPSSTIVIEDPDCDGRPGRPLADIGLYFSSGNRWVGRANTGGGSFSSGNLFDFRFGDQSYSQATLGDFDGDGFDDLLLRFGSDGRSVVRLNQGGGGFDGALYFDTRFPGNGSTQPIAGDFDGDGLDDPGSYQLDTGVVTFRRNEGGGRISSATNTVGIDGADASQFRIFVMDYNSDGLDDIAVAAVLKRDGKASFRVRVNNGDGSFGPEITLSTGLELNNTVGLAGDFDGDGRDDLVACTYSFSTNRWTWRVRRHLGDGNIEDSDYLTRVFGDELALSLLVGELD